MDHTRTSIVSTLIVFFLAACSGSSDEGAAAGADPFVGTWHWQAGATSSVVCNGATVSTTDLSNPNGDGNPAWFTITEEAAGTRLHDVDVLGCVHEYTRQGGVATIVAGSACANYPDGHGGTITATTTSAGRKTVSADGATLSGHGEESVQGQPCTLVVDGTAKRSD